MSVAFDGTAETLETPFDGVTSVDNMITSVVAAIPPQRTTWDTSNIVSGTSLTPANVGGTGVFREDQIPWSQGASSMWPNLLPLVNSSGTRIEASNVYGELANATLDVSHLTGGVINTSHLPTAPTYSTVTVTGYLTANSVSAVYLSGTIDAQNLTGGTVESIPTSSYVSNVWQSGTGTTTVTLTPVPPSSLQVFGAIGVPASNIYADGSVIDQNALPSYLQATKTLVSTTDTVVNVGLVNYPGGSATSQDFTHAVTSNYVYALCNVHIPYSQLLGVPVVSMCNLANIGNTTFEYITVASNATLNAAAVTNNLAVGGSLTVGGSTSLSSATVTNDITVGGQVHGRLAYSNVVPDSIGSILSFDVNQPNYYSSNIYDHLNQTSFTANGLTTTYATTPWVFLRQAYQNTGTSNMSTKFINTTGLKMLSNTGIYASNISGQITWESLPAFLHPVISYDTTYTEIVNTSYGSPSDFVHYGSFVSTNPSEVYSMLLNLYLPVLENSGGNTDTNILAALNAELAAAHPTATLLTSLSQVSSVNYDYNGHIITQTSNMRYSLCNFKTLSSDNSYAINAGYTNLATSNLTVSNDLQCKGTITGTNVRTYGGSDLATAENIASTALAMASVGAIGAIGGAGLFAYLFYTGKMNFPPVDTAGGTQQKSLQQLINDDTAGFNHAVKVAMQGNAVDFLQHIINSMEGNIGGNEQVGNKFLQVVRRAAARGGLDAAPQGLTGQAIELVFGRPS